jgi:hypothetical protein
VIIGAPLEYEERRVVKIVINDRFDKTAVLNDIALFKLDVSFSTSNLITNEKNCFYFHFFSPVFQSPVRYSRSIVPVCLPGDESIDFDDVDALVSSFQTDTNGAAIDLSKIRKSQRAIRLRNDRSCRRRVDTDLSRFDPDLQICATSPTADQTSAFLDAQPVRLTFSILCILT